MKKINKTRLEKFKVCKNCYSVGITDTNCNCVYGEYKTIELEYEVCECCGNVIEDGHPVDTEFNKQQLENDE